MFKEQNLNPIDSPFISHSICHLIHCSIDKFYRPLSNSKLKLKSNVNENPKKKNSEFDSLKKKIKLISSYEEFVTNGFTLLLYVKAYLSYELLLLVNYVELLKS